MSAELQKKLDLMVSNFQELNRAFIWDAGLMKHFGAMITATRESHIDPESIKLAKRIIERETSWMSYFRGSNEFMIAVMMSGDSEAERHFVDAVDLYERLKLTGFRSSPYLAIASYLIAKGSEQERSSQIIDRMSAFYKIMKHNHYWLTSDNDYIYAAILAMTDLDVKLTMEQTENCYRRLNELGLSKGDELQSLSHILALGEESVASKCERAMVLYHALKTRKCKLNSYGLSTLGVLTLLSNNIDQIADEIQMVNEQLRQTKGYGMWTLDDMSRSILAASLVADVYGDQLKDHTLEASLSNSISAILLAQQAAASIAICAATVAATSASSSS